MFLPEHEMSARARFCMYVPFNAALFPELIRVLILFRAHRFNANAAVQNRTGLKFESISNGGASIFE